MKDRGGRGATCRRRGKWTAHLGGQKCRELALGEELVLVHRLDDRDGSRHLGPVRVDDLVQRSQRGGLELHLGLLEHRDEASRGGEAQGGDHGDGAGYRHARTLLTRSKSLLVHAVCLRALPLWRDLPSRSSAQLPLFCFERSGRSQPCRWPQLVGHSGEMNHPLKKDAMSQKGVYRGSGFPLYIRRLMKVRTSPCTPPTRRTTRPARHTRPRENDANFFPTRPTPPPQFRQMDLEYTFWQMYLLCTNPKVVYRHTMYRKREPPTLHPPSTHPPSRAVRNGSTSR